MHAYALPLQVKVHDFHAAPALFDPGEQAHTSWSRGRVADGASPAMASSESASSLVAAAQGCSVRGSCYEPLIMHLEEQICGHAPAGRFPVACLLRLRSTTWDKGGPRSK